MFPFIEDEKNSFLMSRDSGFIDKNRKVRTPVIHFYQNYEQAVATVGAERANALFQSYRNAFMFQQQSPETIKFLSDRAGKKWALSSSFRGAEGRFLASNDDNKEQLSETIEEVDQITDADVSKLEEMEFLGIMVVENEVSEPMKVTSVPSFKMPIFTDENYQPDFDISKKKDKEIFDIWQNCVDEFYIENIKKTSYSQDDFTDEEWNKLLEIKNPINDSIPLFEDTDTDNFNQNDAKADYRNKEAKNDINKGLIIDSKKETLDGEEEQEAPSEEVKESNDKSQKEVVEETQKEVAYITDTIQEIDSAIPPEPSSIIAQNLQTSDDKEDIF